MLVAYTNCLMLCGVVDVDMQKNLECGDDGAREEWVVMGPAYSPFCMDVKLCLALREEYRGWQVIWCWGPETEEVTGEWTKLHDRSFKFVYIFGYH